MPGLTSRLRAGMAANIQVHRTRIAREAERVHGFGERARRAVAPDHRGTAGARRARRAIAGGVLLSRRVLARGFALVRDDAGRPLHTASAVGPGMPVEVEFSDGSVRARAEGAAASPDKPASEPRSRARAAAAPTKAICSRLVSRFRRRGSSLRIAFCRASHSGTRLCASARAADWCRYARGPMDRRC